ncbi:MAG: DUF975 family protein [Muribaculaceae bacterium]|nr:DUF975 family protein [Muribaculaceae bacterium]
MNDHVMMMRQAKQMLANNWLNAAVGALIYGVISGAASFTYIGSLILYGPLTFGFILFIACLADTKVSNFELLFRGFNRFVETLVAGLLYTVIVGIGFMLLIVPGIIAACGLAQAFFIMVDDAEISGIDALKMSWNMMNGHKADWFLLQLRFIGWALLCLLTCGIGYFFLTPYMYVTNLNYYRQLRYGNYLPAK